MHSLFACLILVLFMPLAVHAQDLTGVWKGDDNGTYYIRQVESEIWWFGEKDPVRPSFSNVAHGKLSGDLIQLAWTDVPKGTILHQAH